MARPTIDEDLLLDLVERLHDAPSAPDGWHGALEAMAVAFDGLWCQILVTDFWGGNAPLSDVHPWDPDAHQAYVQHYFNLDPRSHALSNRSLTVWTRQDVIDDEVFRRSEIYNDFLVGIGAEQCLVANLTGFADGPNFLSVMRSEVMGAFTAEERATLRLLAGHIDQAVVLHRTLVRAEAESLAQFGLFDALPIGVCLLGSLGCIRHSNRAGADMLAAADGLAQDRTGRPQAALSAETRRLERIIGQAHLSCRGRHVEPEGAMAISRPSGKRPYTVMVVPLGAHAPVLADGITAVMLIADPERKHEALSDLLRRLYGLTPAEARLAQALVAGERLNDIAERFGIARETARSQLKAVFAKTGTQGQADLMRLAVSGPAGLGSR